jgi:ribonuclease VapC
MVLDTSALLVILLNESEASAFGLAIDADPIRLLSAANLVETSIVIEARVGEAGGRELDLLIHKAAIEVVAVDTVQADLARHAYRQFGKGHYPAGLNYGDCFAYALAQSAGEALLFKGDDFSRTDVAVVPWSRQ